MKNLLMVLWVAILVSGCAHGGAQTTSYDPVGERRAKPQLMTTVVKSDGVYGPGTTIVDSRTRRLYHYGRDGLVYSFPVAIAREDFAWYGTVKVCQPNSGRTGIEYNPRWFPTQRMVDEDNLKPPTKRLGLASFQKNGMPPGGRNPFGSVAIRLCDAVTGQYVVLNIHGTPKEERASVGQASSSGCFRMYDEQAHRLAQLIRPGDVVIVLPVRPGDKLVGNSQSARYQ